MIARLGRWIRGDGANDRRIKVLEAQLVVAHQVVVATREVYLRRLETCGDCPTCRPEPMNFDLAHHEFGDAP